MKELKGLETHEFYSRFFVETALLKQEQMNVTSEEAKKFMGLGEGFYKRFNDLSIHSHDKEKQKEFMGWFHTNLVNELGYKNLEPRVYETKGKDGIVIRGTVKLVDDEELWIVEGHAGYSFNEEDPFEITPNCSSIHLLDEEFSVDKSKNYRKIFDELFSDENESVGWAIYLAGEKTFLLEKEKWLDKGTFIEIDWQEAFNNKSSDTFKAILGLFGARGFKVENGEIPHNLLAETAHREAHGVTKSLKYSVRDALEILINEVLDSHKQNSSPYIENIINTRPEDLAKDLSGQGLRYLYRLLFLFYVEARGRESEILPVKSPSYQLGYSLENMRNLELINKSSIKNGNFIQQTLERTFSLMFSGYNINDYAEFEENIEEDEDVIDEAIYSAGFNCPKVGALLFNPKYTPVFDEVKLSDSVMQKVVAKLSLAEVGTGNNIKTQRISYANLGLNQLGAVYEGLLSLKAVIADQDYYTVVLGAKNEEFLVKKEHYKIFKSSIKKDSNNIELLHKKGTFLFRTMGYERKYSASFYTDETLTQCLVRECLEEYFAGKPSPSMNEIMSMKILEPAMGSGAFLNEVANQLAVYLAKALRRERREYKNKSMKELNDIAKEHIMRNCLYGVDLNPMATELAKVSLWLNCIQQKPNSAFHDFKIRHGNSLVGAFLGNRESWNNDIYHFLIPRPEMIDTLLNANYLDNSKMPFLEKNEQEYLETLQRNIKLKKEYESQLIELSLRVKSLSEEHSKKRKKFQNELFLGNLTELEYSKLYMDYINNNNEYLKLRLIMDYWCSLWFWNRECASLFPGIKDFLSDIECILELKFDGYNSFQKTIKKAKLKRINAAISIIAKIPFFHYDLEFPEVFEKGGFDIVLGNPPWAKLSWSYNEYFSDLNPELQIKKYKASEKKKMFESYLKNSHERSKYADTFVYSVGTRNFLKYSSTYPFIDESESNTYKFFWQRSIQLTKSNGVYGLIKQGGIVSDKGLENIRPVYFRELSKLYNFVNEKKLFEIGHARKYTLAVFRKDKKKIDFELIDGLYHPITIQRCHAASEFDSFPGTKDKNGDWELRGHPGRIIQINSNKMKLLTKLEDLDESEYNKISLPRIFGVSEWVAIEKAISWNDHFKDIDYYWSKAGDEEKFLESGIIEDSIGKKVSVGNAVLTGPNIHIGNPFYQTPYINEKGNICFQKIDLNDLNDDYFVATRYKTTKGVKKSAELDLVKFNDFKICHRVLVDTTISRTLQSALYPAEVKHISGVASLDINDLVDLVLNQACFNSLIFDFYSRSFSTGNLHTYFWDKMPMVKSSSVDSGIVDELLLRSLRLNCLGKCYEKLWEQMWKDSYRKSPSLNFFPPSNSNAGLKQKYSFFSGVRDVFEREQVLCETDALVALLLGFSKKDLINLYRSSFGTLQKVLKDLPGQNEEDSFPRAKIMEAAYDMFLEHFGVTEKDVVAGYFQDKKKAKVA